MKPYLLVLHNKIKLSFLKVLYKGLILNGIQFFSRNSKFIFSKKSSIVLGDRIINDGRIVVIVSDNAKLRIGDGVYFNEDAMISCHEKIIIGNGCQFGPNVKIFDNNHCFDSKNGVTCNYKSSPIEIGEHCWIGANVVILKDTIIGKNTVIGAGCVLSGIIPECSIVTQGRDLHIEKMRK